MPLWRSEVSKVVLGLNLKSCQFSISARYFKSAGSGLRPIGRPRPRTWPLEAFS